jgi:hypothetical protein
MPVGDRSQYGEYRYWRQSASECIEYRLGNFRPGNGLFRVHAFAGAGGNKHLALVNLRFNQVQIHAPGLQIQSERMTGDATGSLRSARGAQLDESLGSIIQAYFVTLLAWTGRFVRDSWKLVS